MKLCPGMIEAIYLRANSDDTLEDADGTIFWFDAKTEKYMYYKPSNRKRKGPYEARGLQCWWDKFLSVCEETVSDCIIKR